MDTIHQGFVSGADLQEPQDVYGAGYLAYQLRTTFRDLCRVIGKEAARQEIADIINSEFERRTIDG